MATNFKSLARENEDLKREIADLKATTSNCSMCGLRKEATPNASIHSTGKPVEQYAHELKLKCEELEADLKKHKIAVDRLKDLLLESKRKSQAFIDSTQFNLKRF